MTSGQPEFGRPMRRIDRNTRRSSPDASLEEDDEKYRRKTTAGLIEQSVKMLNLLPSNAKRPPNCPVIKAGGVVMPV